MASLVRMQARGFLLPKIKTIFWRSPCPASEFLEEIYHREQIETVEDSPADGEDI